MKQTKDYIQELQDRINLTSESRQPFLSQILKFLSENKDTPASSSKSKHGCFDGGLIAHSCVVIRIALALGNSSAFRDSTQDLLNAEEMPFWNDDFLVAKTQFSELSYQSIVTAGLIHDLNKATTLSGCPYYVPNILKSGKRSDAKPWEITDSADPFAALLSNLKKDAAYVAAVPATEVFLNSGGINYREGLVSLTIAEMLAPGIVANLTESEKQAIIFHDGAYVGRSEFTGKETPLQIVIHAADMLASRFFC